MVEEFPEREKWHLRIGRDYGGHIFSSAENKEQALPEAPNLLLLGAQTA